MALGARPSMSCCSSSAGSALVSIGVLVGLVAAAALMRSLSGFFFDVSAADPAVLALVTVILVTVSIVACGIPRAGPPVSTGDQRPVVR